MQGNAYTAIQGRLDAFESSRDPRFVVDPQALAEVAELRASIGWPAFSPVPDDAVIRRALAAIVLAGSFLFPRWSVQPGGFALDEMLQAMDRRGAAYPAPPSVVPGPGREVCTDLSSSPPGIDDVA